MGPARGDDLRRTLLVLAAWLIGVANIGAQTTSVFQGRVLDSTGAVVANAAVSMEDAAAGFSVLRTADHDGRFFIPALSPGHYRVAVTAPGFRTAIIEVLTIDVGRTLQREFHLALGEQRETVVVHAETPLVDLASATVGHVVPSATMQQVPLNGRHFIDLSLLVPGAVAPSQNGFSSRPIRGVGALAFNISGNREEAVGFHVNGVSTNNLTFGSLIFEPPLDSIEEVKIDSSGLPAEYGHVSGAVVNIATRAGSEQFHGGAFEFFRDEALDAKNYFESTADPAPFSRNQFGGSFGGPLWRNRTFLFGTYEGLRQRQGLAMNSLVLSDAQRAAVTDPVVRRLLPLIPIANSVDASGAARWIGSAEAVADTDRWAIDVRHNLGAADRLQGYFGNQYVRAVEPAGGGNSIPGFGSVLHPYANILTLSETHVFGASAVNELRFGRSYLHGGTFPGAALNPAEFGIADGVTRPIGLPQIVVAGDLNFGGPGNLPQGRIDTSYVVNDTYSRARGRHAIKLGGEYRHFINDNFAEGTGTLNVPSIAAFMTGTANSFATTLGERRSVIDQQAIGLFAQDRISAGDRLTIELGLRYEWHVTPTERDNKLVVFDAATASLLRVGVDLDRIYQQNNRNLEPRAGLAFRLSADGRTVARAAYARTVDEPVTTAVRDTAGNPPWAVPLTASGAISFSGALDTTRPGGLAPSTVDPNFKNASLDSWNVSVQRQIAAEMAITVAYLGSRGHDLRISRNLNQPADGIRPYTTLAATSPIQPGASLGNITQVESTGFSRYDGAAFGITRRLSKGLQFDASYTLSKARDTNSLNSLGFSVQDSDDIPAQFGLADFDARHRFVVSTSYAVPSGTHVWNRGWELAAVIQAQSGNPFTIVTSNASLNGVPNTVRPDVTGPITIIGDVNHWFDPSVFVAAPHFGNLGRNTVPGPAFRNADVSLIKEDRVTRDVRLQFRLDVFDLFNHANFASPGNIVGTPAFGKITRTRLPSGEAASSRQVQLVMKALF
jgi:hypothetical protein